MISFAKYNSLSISNKHLIVIGGPTASGKTSLSIALAKHYSCPIISADSRQFYREMSIGTAKPDTDELAAAEHHLINSLSIHEPYSVGQFERDVIALLNRLYQQHDVVILVGGTGLYIKAVCEGLDDFAKVNQTDVQYYQNLFDTNGITFLQKELQEQDLEYAATVDMYNSHRLIRALSYIKSTGQKFSAQLNKKTIARQFTPHYISLALDRKLLYDRINRRVDQMILNGLTEEVKILYPYKHLNSLNTVGYKELFRHFDGEWTLEQAIDKIKQHSRNYAKRQITWFKNQGDWQHVDPSKTELVLQYLDGSMN